MRIPRLTRSRGIVLLAAGTLAKGVAVSCSTSSVGPSGRTGTTGNVSAAPTAISASE